MKTLLLFLIPLSYTFSQNLINNPSFEHEVTGFDSPMSEAYVYGGDGLARNFQFVVWGKHLSREEIIGTEFIKDWVLPTYSLPWYRRIHNKTVWLKNTPEPKTGKGAIILRTSKSDNSGAMRYENSAYYMYEAPGIRSYIQTKLKEPLIKDKKYIFSIHLARNGYSQGITEFGFLLTKQPELNYKFVYSADTTYINKPAFCTGLVTNEGAINFRMIETDENYVKLCTTFVASGGEQYLTLGNFDSEEHISVNRWLKLKEKHFLCEDNGEVSSFGFSLLNQGNVVDYTIDDVELIAYDENLDCNSPKNALNNTKTLLYIDLSSSMRKYLNVLVDNIFIVDSLRKDIDIELAGFNHSFFVMDKEIISTNGKEALWNTLNNKLENATLFNETTDKMVEHIHQLNNINKVILITDGDFRLNQKAKESIENMFYFDKINFSVINVREKKSSGLSDIAKKTKGEYYNSSDSTFSKIFLEEMNQMPVENIESCYLTDEQYQFLLKEARKSTLRNFFKK